jgi:uncharacterized protein YwqG
MDIQFPENFLEKQDIILATKTTFIHIEPFEVNDEESLKEELPKSWYSKYLGLPYMPKNFKYPHSKNGRPLALLAQINFAETPKLEGYPTAGILQFFIADDDLWGLEFTDPYDSVEQFKLQTSQNNFRVIYHPEIIEDENFLITSVDFLPDFNYLPVERECRLEFSLREEVVWHNDYRFERLLGEGFLASLTEEEEKAWADFTEKFTSQGNKIGGYADFVQQDVRRFLTPPDENWLLLLQIDEADNARIQWGDSGVGNFFIEEKALGALDFSRVLYNWDCG